MYGHLTEDVSKGANDKAVHRSKHSLASSLQHLFRRKHKTKTLTNGSTVEATILENDEAAAEEEAEQKRRTRDLVAADSGGGDDLRAATLPRAKKNK